MTVHATPRRLTMLVAALLSSVLFLTACSGGNDNESADVGESSSAGYPVTVPAAYGDFTLDKKPSRIVVIGVENVDLLNALGEKPVAFAAAGEADEEALNAGSPWIADLYSAGEYDPSLITSEYKVSLEAVAEQNPDLIIGSSFYIEQPQYEELSKLAPTYVKVTSPDRDWKADFTDLGELLGKSDQAQNALTDLDAKYAAAKETLPGLQGQDHQHRLVQRGRRSYATHLQLGRGSRSGSGREPACLRYSRSDAVGGEPGSVRRRCGHPQCHRPRTCCPGGRSALQPAALRGERNVHLQRPHTHRRRALGRACKSELVAYGNRGDARTVEVELRRTVGTLELE
ncbi:ABC transporter substrate-binding protein [Williamsia sp. 1135]|uniref:ABC transporter substrate-binding protein n=1 Tax=Williamsia sp. 1135 TaxID=1889262 RepID=UPI000A10BED3|nr:ABC transporter substrate-binding protein [Williamsia sp. 1135]ORM35323.1 hypothetical protein BFL43_09680 [Williamsia sp. 1135]